MSLPRSPPDIHMPSFFVEVTIGLDLTEFGVLFASPPRMAEAVLCACRTRHRED